MLQLQQALGEAQGTEDAREYAALLAEAKDRPRLRMHSFHRWYGKLVPAIPAAAIELWSEPGELGAGQSRWTISPAFASSSSGESDSAQARVSNGKQIAAANVKSRVADHVFEPPWRIIGAPRRLCDALQ